MTSNWTTMTCYLREGPTHSHGPRHPYGPAFSRTPLVNLKPQSRQNLPLHHILPLRPNSELRPLQPDPSPLSRSPVRQLQLQLQLSQSPQFPPHLSPNLLRLRPLSSQSPQLQRRPPNLVLLPRNQPSRRQPSRIQFQPHLDRLQLKVLLSQRRLLPQHHLNLQIQP